MEFQVTVNLDHIGEDYTVDECLEARLVNKIVEQISKDVSKGLKEKAYNRFNEKADEFVTAALKKYIDGPISITDSYGDPIEQHDGIDELLKHKFETFMSQRVDSKGNPTNSCGYGDKYTRLTHLLDSKIEKRGKKINMQIIKEVDKKIEEEMVKVIKNTLTDKLLTQVDMEKLIEEAKKK